MAHRPHTTLYVLEQNTTLIYVCTSVPYPIPHCTISPGNNSTNCASDITLVQGPSCAIVNICMLKNKNPFIILRKRQFYAQEVKFSPIPGTVTCDDGRDDLKTWSLCCIIAPSHHSVTTAFRIQLLLKFEDASLEMGFRMTFQCTFTRRKEHQVASLWNTTHAGAKTPTSSNAFPHSRRIPLCIRSWIWTFCKNPEKDLYI